MKRIIGKAGKNSKHPDKKTGIMAKKISHILMIGVFALCSLCSSVEAAEQREGTAAPETNKGKKWRIGYIEGGPWRDYRSNLAALIINLAKMGWIENKSFPAYKDELAGIYSSLSAQVAGYQTLFAEFPIVGRKRSVWTRLLTTRRMIRTLTG